MQPFEKASFLVLWAAASFICADALAQDPKSEIQRYRQMVAEGSPAELFELEGEELWKKPQGPKNVSLQRCDLGEGPGVLKAAYAHLPRYFKDADRVMDLEARLVHCMVTQQGRSREDAIARLFGTADRPSELELLSIYIAGQSRGVRLEPGMSHPKEKASYELYDELKGKSKHWARMYPDWLKFRNEQFLWFRVAEHTYDTYAFNSKLGSSAK